MFVEDAVFLHVYKVVHRCQPTISVGKHHPINIKTERTIVKETSIVKYERTAKIKFNSLMSTSNICMLSFRTLASTCYM